jgi:thiamine biosynthesis lipoprotein
MARTAVPRWRLLAALAAPFAASPARAAERPVVAWEGRTMGTVYTVKLVEPKLSESELAALKVEIDARLVELNRQMSNYQPDSELSRFNRAPAGVPFKVSPEFARVVRFALEISRRTDGAFDPTLGPLIDLWGFGAQGRPKQLPPDTAVAAARQLTGWHHLAVTPADELVKDLPGLTLDLGAVAKGFGSDEIVALLRRRHIADAYVAIAGEVRVTGRNPFGGKWRIGIAAPLDEWRDSDPMAAAALLENQSLSTSGDYQNFFRDPQGRRLCHIIDPRTARPIQHMLGGVSVVASDSITADALGTALFVLGPDAGIRFIDAWPDAAALFIVRQPDGSFRQFPSKRFAELAAP